VTSWFDFAKAIFELEDIDIKLNPILMKRIQLQQRRPLYSLLDKSKINKEFNLKIPYSNKMV